MQSKCKCIRSNIRVLLQAYVHSLWLRYKVCDDNDHFIYQMHNIIYYRFFFTEKFTRNYKCELHRVLEVWWIWIMSKCRSQDVESGTTFSTGFCLSPESNIIQVPLSGNSFITNKLHFYVYIRYTQGSQRVMGVVCSSGLWKI